MADGFPLHVLSLLKRDACGMHIPIHLPTSYIHPSTLFFLSIIDSSFYPFTSFHFFPSTMIPLYSTTSYDDKTWKQILPKPPPHPTTQPSFVSIHTASTNTPVHLKYPTPAHQNPKRPISPSVSHPRSFIHRATAVLGRRVAHAERKRARCGGMECCLAFWYREGIWEVGL